MREPSILYKKAMLAVTTTVILGLPCQALLSDLGAWVPDRTAPDAFVLDTLNGEPVVRMSIDGDNKHPGGNLFWDTHGMKRPTLLNPGHDQSLVIHMFVGQDWETEDRSVGMWAQMRDDVGNESGFPILAFRGFGPHPDGLWGPVTPGFYAYDYLAGTYSVGFLEVTEFDRWYTLAIEMLVDEGIRYSIDGQEIGFFPDPLPWSYHLDNVFLNAFNFGDDHDIYFRRLEATDSMIPEPSSILLAGLAAGALALRRRRMARRRRR